MSRHLVWHPPAGPPLPLTDPANGVDVLWHLTGFMRPTYTVTRRRYPGQHGSRLRSVKANERELEVGVMVEGETRTEFLYRARRLVRSVRPLEGLGRLEVHEPDGSRRWVDAVCTDGLEGSELNGSGDATWWKPVLSFLAPHPFARSASITESWTLASSGRSWFPILPISLGASGVGGRQVVHNPGDVEAFPVISVTGPGTDLVAVNRTSGKSAHLDYVIPGAGPEATVTIDTRRGAQKIVDGYGNNLFEYLTDDDPSLWSLLPGDNEVEIRLSGTGPGSSVSVSFDPLYESL